MIRLTKQPAPAILAANAAAWTAEYQVALATGDEIPDRVRYRYRHPDVKNGLRMEAHDKCVYCETKLTSSETDHISPVTRRPDLIVDWHNLALVCKDCNTYKGSYYAPTEPLINPFVDDPMQHLVAFGPLIMNRTGDALGRRTILQIRLQRNGLLERRAERVIHLQLLVSEFVAQPAGETKELLERAVRDEAADDSEYAAVVRSYLFQELGWRI